MDLDTTAVWIVTGGIWLYVFMRSMVLWASYRDLMIGLIGMASLCLLGVSVIHVLDDIGPWQGVLTHARTANWGRSMYTSAGVLVMCAICMYEGSRQRSDTWVDTLRRPIESYFRRRQHEASTDRTAHTSGGEPAP